MKKLFTTKRPTINWFTALVCIVAYYSFIINIPIFKHFVQIFSDMENFSYFFAISVPIVLFTLVLSVFTLFSSKYLFKPFFILLLLSSGPVFYSQFFYHIVYDYDMIQNFAQTNIYEARSYLTTQSFIIVFLISVIPAFFLLITNITYPKTFVNGLIKKLIIILSYLALQ